LIALTAQLSVTWAAGQHETRAWSRRPGTPAMPRATMT
jgi:hypothetical protein